MTTHDGSNQNTPPAAQSTAHLWERATKAADMTLQQKAKCLVYGPSGSGKTTLAAKFKRPLIGVTEMQGVPAIMRANPQARVFPIQSAQELNDFRNLIRDPKLHEQVDAVVLDSLTDVQRIIKVAYTAAQNVAKAKAGKETRDAPDVETWGLIIDRTAKIAREVRDLQTHVVVICLDSEVLVEGVGRIHRPAVNGKSLPNDLAQYFNLVGYSFKRSVEGVGVRHEVLFNGPDAYITKGMPELRDTEPPEPLYWAHRAFGHPLPKDVRERVEDWEARSHVAQDEHDETPAPAPEPAPKARRGGKAAAPAAAVAAPSEDPFI